MLFNTPQYIIFLPIVVIIYYVLPKKVRYLWLLVVSYYFYMQWNPLYITLLFSCTLLTYVCGRIVERLRQSGDTIKEIEGHERENLEIKKRQRICLAVCILLNLCILAYFKYFEFGIRCLNFLFRRIHVA